MTEGLRVLIVDDHPVLRRGLRLLLDGQSWVGEIYEVDTADAALKEAVIHDVHLVVMDVALPDGDGVDATERILKSCPNAKIAVFTWTGDSSIVTRALGAGAHGYILKETEPDSIVSALKAIVDGGLVLGPNIDVFRLTEAPGSRCLPTPFDKLTAREREILAGVAVGDANSAIAWHLGLSEKTVRNQLSAIFVKIGVSNRIQAARRVHATGVVL